MYKLKKLALTGKNNEQYVTPTPNISEGVTKIHVINKKISLAKLTGLLDLNLNLM